MRAEEFAASVGFDALRVSMGGRPRLHDVDTICRWLRHISAETGGATPASGTAAAPAAETLGSAEGKGPAPQGRRPT